ncbi:MAG: hypothetical protein KIT84_15080 [Labilithrix sp.]|nr:hypothetical protein [Labilithrix sp.]MCW5812347.1 hypothetical protein [Labilithrix sp.]
MKRSRSPLALAAGLAFAAAVVACHAFLDPDDLVSGIAADGGTSPVVDPDGSTSGGSSGDTGVPGCVPAPPSGAQVVAVVRGSPGAVPACPSGYEASGQIGFGDVANDTFECATGSCACGAATGSADSIKCVTPALSFYSDDTCTTKVGSSPFTNVILGCPRVARPATATHAQVTAVPQAADATSVCPPSGTPTTTKQPPRVDLEVHVCRPTAQPSSTCSGGDAPAVAATTGSACYVSTSGSCAAPWREQRSYSPAPDFTDTRACQCACALDPASVKCSGGTVHRAPTAGAACSSGEPVPDAPCRAVADYGTTTMRLEKVPEADPTDAKCVPTTTKEGDVTFTNAPSLQLCCLSECTVCRQAAIAPGGACATTIKACTDDAECKPYYDCRQTCGSSSGGSCSACTEPAPAAAALYEAIATCRSKACSASRCRNDDDS